MLLSALLGLLAGLTVGVVLAILSDRRHRRRNPPPVCGCKHHYALHDPATGTCKAKMNVPKWRPGYGMRADWVDCTCQVYTGPTPVQVTWSAGLAILAVDPPRSPHG